MEFVKNCIMYIFTKINITIIYQSELINFTLLLTFEKKIDVI